MPTESGFLRAITARPDDVTHRLVYADWLDERMQALAVFSDRFWALKPRRAELRARRDPGWLAVMGYGDPYRLSFAHGIPEGWKERWRLIRAFTEIWYGKPMPDVGGRRGRVEEIEKQLGRALAPAVREWVTFAEDVVVEGYPSHLFYTQSGYEIDVGWLPVLDGYTIARQDYDGGTLHQCVRDADQHHPDPPLTLVTSFINEAEEPPQRHYVIRATDEADGHEFGDRVTTFALGQALEWLRGEREFFGHVPDARSDPFLARMRDEFPVHVRFLGREVFEAPELLVMLKRTAYPGPGWGVHARVRRPSRQVRKSVPAVFWELITSTAKREGRSSSSLTDAHGFRSAFNRAAGRLAVSRVVLVDR
jgi:uncharacterized protein (TIGR02996 family)